MKDFNGAKQIITGQFQRVFLAIGRKEIGHFSEYTQHFYLLRVIDSSPVNFGPPNSQIIIDKGPYTFENDKKLLLKYNITKIITKSLRTSETLNLFGSRFLSSVSTTGPLRRGSRVLELPDMYPRGM